MKNNKMTTGESLTHTAAFRINESQHDEFLQLLNRIPGSQAGNLYREIFARGLDSLKAFYAQRGRSEDAGAAPEKGGQR